MEKTVQAFSWSNISGLNQDEFPGKQNDCTGRKCFIKAISALLLRACFGLKTRNLMKILRKKIWWNPKDGTKKWLGREREGGQAKEHENNFLQKGKSKSKRSACQEKEMWWVMKRWGGNGCKSQRTTTVRPMTFPTKEGEDITMMQR